MLSYNSKYSAGVLLEVFGIGGVFLNYSIDS